MKKFSLLLTISLCACLLAGCGAAGRGERAPGGAPSGEAQPGGETSQPALVTAVCRVVAEEDGRLLLAEAEGSGVYSLPLDGTNVTLDGKDTDLLEPGAYMDLPARKLAGALVEVMFDGVILDTWPAQLANIAAVNIRSDGYDDRCGLYLQVLEDLWEVDPGLNSDSGLKYLGMDLSRLTHLTDAERAAVAWRFAEKHGLELVEGTFEELAEQGYFTASHISTPAPEEGEPAPAVWYQWEDGIFFSITTDEEAVWNLPMLGAGDEPPTLTAFDARKWCSGTGAYFFDGCTGRRQEDGTWTYSVGSEAIS